MDIRNFLAKGKKSLEEQLTQHLVDSAAIFSVGNPIWAVVETKGYGMTPEVSWNAKITGSLTVLAGMGYLYGKGRDLYQKAIGITKETPKWKKTLSELPYGAAFAGVFTPLIYGISGETDPERLMLATGMAMVSNIPMSIINGCAIDLARDLTNINKEPKIIGEKLYSQNRLKKTLAGTLAGLSAAATYAYLKLYL